MDQIQIPRTGDVPLRFTGERIASGTSRRDGAKHPQKQWYEAELYRTTGGNYVAHGIYKTEWTNERECHWAAAFDKRYAAVDWMYNLEVTDIVIGYPAGPRFAGQQEQLLARLEQQWDALVADLLNQCGKEFAEEVK
jgi:hypothetical protein